MPAKCGLVCESALTETTHVGFLSRVNSLVPLEGIELGELFIAVFAAVRTLTLGARTQQSTVEDVYASNRTRVTVVSAVTCVYFQMLVEGVSLSEASATVLTLVWLGPGVDV